MKSIVFAGAISLVLFSASAAFAGTPNVGTPNKEQTIPIAQKQVSKTTTGETKNCQRTLKRKCHKKAASAKAIQVNSK